MAFAVVGTGVRELEIRSFFDVNPAPQFLLDPQRQIRGANSAALRVFSRGGAPLEGRWFDELFSATSRLSLDALFTVVGAPEALPHKVAVEGLGADGRTFPAELVAIRLSGANPGGFGIVLRDLRDPPASRIPSPVATVGTYTVAELLLANRLRELV